MVMGQRSRTGEPADHPGLPLGSLRSKSSQNASPAPAQSAKSPPTTRPSALSSGASIGTGTCASAGPSVVSGVLVSLVNEEHAKSAAISAPSPPPAQAT